MVGYCVCLHQLSSGEHDHQEWAYLQTASPYLPAQPLLEHDLPLWLEEGDEDEVYSAPLCTLEATHGGPQTEDDLNENLIQNPPPSVLPLKELVEGT